jgi:hypothetical protein
MNTKPFNLTLVLLALVSIGFCGSPTFAEDIRVPIGQQGQESATEVPRTGMTKAAVEQKFGAPLQQSAAVGTPPISRWTYSDFVVYFEHDHVIRSVKVFHRKPDTETVISE